MSNYTTFWYICNVYNRVQNSLSFNIAYTCFICVPFREEKKKYTKHEHVYSLTCFREFIFTSTTK